MGLSRELHRQGEWLFRWRSFLPLLFLPPLIVAVLNMKWPDGGHRLREGWEVWCAAVSVAGLAVRVLTVGHAPANTSGRNTHAGQIAETLNTTGAYSVVRNPLYLGNFLIGLGAVMFPLQWWLVGMYTLAFWLYYERIVMTEEAFLHGKFGEAFEQWARKTPAFIPNLSRWKTPSLPFSWRNACRREYTALGLMTLLLTSIEVGEHFVIEGRFVLEPVWGWFLLFGLSTYVLLRYLKRYTTLLEVEGR